MNEDQIQELIAAIELYSITDTKLVLDEDLLDAQMYTQIHESHAELDAQEDERY